MTPDGLAGPLGREPEGIWSAPGRVNLIGEYTDLNEGFVLPLAIAQRTRVAAARRGDRRLTVRSRESPERGAVEVDLDALTERTTGWEAYPLAVARALDDAGVEVGGADLVFTSDVPIGAGLSSSAALECAAGLALSGLAGVELEPIELARIAQRAENLYVGVPCGLMDQAATMCCTEGNALLLDTRTRELRQVPLALEAHGLLLLVIDTGVKHALGESAYAERRRSCEEAAATLGLKALRDVPPEEVDPALARLREAGGDLLVRRARHVLTEQRRVLEVVDRLAAGDPAAIGPLLLAGHRSLRDDFEVSCPELDAAVDAAVAAGAIGARMTGAGFGGSAIALVRSSGVEEICSAVRSAFAARGYREPTCFPVTASAGARRDA